MRGSTLTKMLRSSVALGAIVLASSANAACNTANGVVTCTGTSTTDQAQAAINTTPSPSVTVVVAGGATVTRGFGSIFGPNPVSFPSYVTPRFPGAIGYTNDGTVGTPTATVDFQSTGVPSSAASTFTLINRGTQNGAIRASDFGGVITATNSGTVTGGIDLRGPASIVFTNTGAVGNNSQFSFGPAVALNSARTETTFDADGTQRTTTTGGAVTATIGGTIGLPAQGSTTPRTQGVQVFAVAGADVTVTGTAADISVRAGATPSSNLFRQTVSGQTLTQTSANGQITTGGDARLTVADTGRIAGAQVFSQGGTATAVVNGAVGTNTVSGSISVTSAGTDTNNRSTSTRNISVGFPTTSTSSNSSTNVGKAALVDVGTTGRVTGGVSTFSNAGPATTRVAGVVGTTNFFTFASSSSRGTNTTSQSSSANAADGSFTSTSSSTQALSGGAALTVIAATGDVFGSASANGDGPTELTNAGRVRGTASAISASFITPVQSFTQSRTITNGAGGVRTTVDQNSSTQTSEQAGGTASLTNTAGALVEGSAQVSSVGGATIGNSGTILGSVSLSSSGTRSTSTNSGRTTATTTPATGGGFVNTVVQTSTNTSSQRPVGGAVTGIYSGTVGVAPSPTFGTFSNVSQNATTTSAATITGRVFADFFGSAGEQNVDSANASTSSQVTQPSGAYTRDQSNTSSQTTTATASTSTLTVGATGIVARSNSGNGNVTLTSAGGASGFTLDGGRVDGSVAVNGGTGFNTTQTSASSSSFTRAAQTSPFVFVPEVQQTQVNTSSFDQRAARGAATATVNGGSIGGDLTVIGTGIGAGTLAASALVNGTVTGIVSAGALPRDSRSSSSDTGTRTGPNTVVRTLTSSSFDGPSSDSGNVLVTVNGIAGGGIAANAGAGSATVNLAGRAGNVTPNGVQVTALDFATQRDSTTTSAGSSSFFFSNQRTASRTTTSSTAIGGTATLNVTPISPASTASSIEGDVVVQGLAGSVLSVAAGSRLVQTAGNVSVGLSINNTTNDTQGVFTNGVQTGSMGSSTTTVVGGPAFLINAGVIGSAANQPLVSVTSVDGATARNSGTINGSLSTLSGAINRSTTTTTTNINDFVLRRTVATTASTPVGVAALTDNSGLITGDVTTRAASGVIINTGVVRGLVTMGAGFANYTTTATTTINPTTGATVTTAAPSVVNPVLFTQTYRLDQNGLLLGGVNVTGATITDPSGATVRTSNVNATVNLNNGSITLGNITADANTNTNVNLNGAGFLGVAANDLPANLVPGQIVTGFTPTPSIAPYTSIDPALSAGVPLPSGSRVTGVQTLTKTGDGTFVIVGAPLLLASAGATAPTYTLDVGTVRVSGGELQLGLAGTTATANSFGIRGSVENNASLVIGRRVTDGTQTAVRGINVAVGGNLNNAAAGNLVVGVNPSFVRTNNGVPASSGGTFGAINPTPFVPFAAQAGSFGSTNSFVRVDGNLTLAGNVAVVAPVGGIYEAGRAYDLFNVGGTYSNTGTLRSNLASPFISFTLTPRSEGGRTLVSLDVARANFDTVTTDRNSAAAARALQTAIPGVASGLRGGSAGVQDLASIIAALDTQFTAGQSAEAFRQLSSGEFYGSIAAIATTTPFGEATDGLPTADAASGVGLWFRPTGQFATYKANEFAGASAINLDNYGGSVGLNFTTGAGGSVGIAGGYGTLKVRAAGTPERGEARTYMVGAYVAQELGNLHVSGQAVYGWNDWDVTRAMPIFARTATGSFKSNEARASVRVAYAIPIDTRIALTPFARGELRYFRFDRFDEQGAGSIALSVGRRAKTVFNPEVGMRLAGSNANGRIRPFAEGSYIFQGNPGTDRQVAFLGNPATAFSLQGVRPGDAIKAAIGATADAGPISLFLRADYASGGLQQVGSVRGGALIRF